MNGRLLHLTARRFDEVKIIVVPQLAESISEGDIRWEKAVGDSVEADEVIGEIETDKTSVPINSPGAGVIEELLVEDGATVKPGQQIIKLKLGASGGSSASQPAASSPSEPAKPAASESAAAEPAAASSTPPPSSKPPVPPKPSAPSAVKDVSKVSAKPLDTADSQPKVIGTRSENRVKINRMRGRIAQRLKDAQNTYAMLTTFNEIDMSNAIEMRNLHKDAFLKKHNLKLGFMSTFVAATAYALRDQPVVNAVIDDQEIIYRDYIDISVAVATPKGLVVPVVRNVENMNYAEIEKAIAALGEKVCGLIRLGSLI